MKLRPSYSVLLLIALAGMTQSAMHAQGHVPEADDAYHLQSWEGSPYNPFYTEWWYFNLYDKKDDIQAIFTYQVGDPLNLTGFGVGDMTAVVYQRNNIITESDLYPLSSFTASNTAANVTLGANTITVAGPNSYFIAGGSLDGRLSWNLHYDRETPSWFAGDHINVAPMAWEQMSWLIYMPRADVGGTLTIDGKTYDVHTSGYHDHNWGQWNFSSVIWNWAQYSQQGLSFDLGDFVGNPNGRASIDVGGKRYVFAASQYNLVHTKWGFDAQDNLPYPTESILTADNGEVKLHVVMDVLKTEPLATGPPPSLVIYEQPCRFKGSVTFHDEWFPFAIPFEGDGFKEYTAITSATP